MIKFSVIVAIYNIENYINKCISSIVNQTYQNLEIILVNDGSKDCSLYYCKLWLKKDSRIVIIDKKNGGLSSARNEGLKHASGDYIAYIDGDDWIAEDMFEILNRKILELGNVDLVCFNFWNYYSEKNCIVVSYIIQPDTIYSGIDFFEKATFRLSAWSKIYNRKFIKDQRMFFLEGHLHEDISYTVPLCLCANKIFFIDKPMYYYRLNRPNSIMQMIKEKNVNDFIYALCFGYNYIKEKGVSSNYYYRWLINAFLFGCLTHLTRYQILSKYMKLNQVKYIIKDLAINSYYNNLKAKILCFSFYNILFCTHFYIKSKAIIGSIIHKKKRM